jgi:FixJ family two-component response regulator
MDSPAEAPHAFAMPSRRQRGADDHPLVTVVDDDESVRESLPDLLREFGFSARAFASAEEFLRSDAARQSRCLVLDVAMPGMNGLDLQRELARRGLAIPIVFITAQKDEVVRARALAQGAAGFLHKPFSDSALLEALRSAMPGD